MINKCSNSGGKKKGIETNFTKIYKNIINPLQV
jgi:hypothetical protein